VAAVSAVPAAAIARATAKNPTQAQIRSAVRRAERSTSLWATVNICDTKRYPNTIGVRGQMPSLGFPAWLSMNVQLYYFSPTEKRFLAVPKGGTKTVRLGRSSSGLEQDGATFAFAPPVGPLDATIQFVWQRAGKLLGETTLHTTAGHRDADFGSPAHYSAKQCRIR
jgi:hypothetical protein